MHDTQSHHLQLTLPGTSPYFQMITLRLLRTRINNNASLISLDIQDVPIGESADVTKKTAGISLQTDIESDIIWYLSQWRFNSPTHIHTFHCGINIINDITALSNNGNRRSEQLPTSKASGDVANIRKELQELKDLILNVAKDRLTGSFVTTSQDTTMFHGIAAMKPVSSSLLFHIDTVSPSLVRKIQVKYINMALLVLPNQASGEFTWQNSMDSLSSWKRTTYWTNLLLC